MRCPWAVGPEYEPYHDAEWGRPVADDDGLFERLCLEGFQSGLVWGFAPRGRRRAPRSLADVPATTPESAALSRELKRRGFRFVGPTTVYATMQACGVVDDHLLGCFVRGEVERQRRGGVATVPPGGPPPPPPPTPVPPPP